MTDFAGFFCIHRNIACFSVMFGKLTRNVAMSKEQSGSDWISESIFSQSRKKKLKKPSTD